MSVEGWEQDGAGVVAAGRRAWGRGVVLGRTLERRPLPISEEVLRTPIQVTGVNRVPLPARTWRERALAFLQAAGIYSVPRLTRLRWAARDHIDRLQNQLLPPGTPTAGKAGTGPTAGKVGMGKGGGGGRRGPGITHPAQLLPVMEFLMGLPADMARERRVLRVLLGRALIDYRKAISQQRGTPIYFFREASKYFARGYHDQCLLARVGAQAERFDTMQTIICNYHYFKIYYLSAILAREPMDGGGKLFPKFLRMVFFTASVEDDGTLAAKPARRALPPKEHVLFLARRDGALQARLREEPALQKEMQQVLRYFRSMGTRA